MFCQVKIISFVKILILFFRFIAAHNLFSKVSIIDGTSDWRLACRAECLLGAAYSTLGKLINAPDFLPLCIKNSTVFVRHPSLKKVLCQAKNAKALIERSKKGIYIFLIFSDFG